MKICIAGTFDPFTLGHKWLWNYANKLMADNAGIIIGDHKDKQPQLPLSSRKQQIENALATKVIMLNSSELLPNVMVQHGYNTLLRGLRNANDFAYEADIASIYRDINADINIIYATPPPELRHISSSLVRQLNKYDDISNKYLGI